MTTYEIYALRYATVERTERQNFMAVDAHDGPMPMDYYVWVIKGGGRVVLVDTGFGEQAAKSRGRQLIYHPVAALQNFGVTPSDVEDVVVSHMHYDHAGNLDAFPNARFHIQEKEIAFATGRLMRYPLLRHPFDVEDVVRVVRYVHDGRVVFYDGLGVLFPGLSIHLVSGHSQGLQVVRVATNRGPVVLASDAAHFYRNISEGNPFPILSDVESSLEGHDELCRLSGGIDHIIPGHDPLVRQQYPRVEGSGFEACVLHAAPEGR